MLPHRLGPVNRWDFDEFTYIGRSPPSAQGSTPSCGLFEKNGKKYRGKSDVLLDPLHTLRNALSEMCSNDIYALYGCRAQSMCISEQKWLPGSEVFAEQANMPPSGIHLMCEWIDNLQMFDESWLSSLQSPESPLTVVTADVRQLVVSGLGRVLAVALFLNDIDCLGGRLKNIGYILPTDESGPQVAHVVKIDPGFAFHLCDRHPSTPSHEHIKLLSDSYKSIARAEIKYATALPPLHFYSLPSSVRVEFLETLSLILTTDRGTMRSWFARPGFEPLYPDELGIGVRLQFLQDRMSALHETFGPLMLSPTLSTTSASSTSSITCVSALPTAKDGWYYSGKTSKFVLGQVLGFGSTVIAYKATLEGFPVCAKTALALAIPEYGVQPGSAEYTELCEELKRKGQKMSKLKHKNLITVHGVIHDTADISKYIVTEVGLPLDKYLDTHPGALTEQLVLNITKSVLEGLHYLHSRDPPIIHGDLKPNAIFIIERCGSLLVKLGDVDSSRLEAASRNTRRRRAPVYSAPELLRNLSQAFDQKSDMYSFGVVLSEALLKHFQPPGSKTPVTYENPFQSFESGEALVSEAANVLKSIDPGISSILESCCEPDVSRRLFADEAADAVHQIQSTALIQVDTISSPLLPGVADLAAPSDWQSSIVSEIKHLIPVEVMCGADEATLLSLVSSKLVWLREQTFFSHQLEARRKAALAESRQTCWLEFRSPPLTPDEQTEVDKTEFVDLLTTSLLQLCAPVTVLQYRSKLPKHVALEYALSQEHFDLARLLFKYSASGDGEGIPAERSSVLMKLMDKPVKKTLAYTRLSATVLGLQDTDPKGSVTVPLHGCGGRLVAVKHLFHLRSRFGLVAYLDEFMDSDNPCEALLIVVDLSASDVTVEARHLDSLRHLIDERGDLLRKKQLNVFDGILQSADLPSEPAMFYSSCLTAFTASVATQTSKHVVICLSTPPDKTVIPAVFSNDWVFTYLNSDSEELGSVSANCWVQVALDEGLHGFPSHAAQALSGVHDDDHLHFIAQAVQCGLTRLDRGSPDSSGVEMQPFYLRDDLRQSNLSARVDALRRLRDVMGGQTLGSVVGSRFLSLFTRQDIVQQLHAALAKSSSSPESLTFELNRSIRGLYNRFSSFVYEKAARGYNLQSLYAMYSHPPVPVSLLHQFTRAALESWCPTSLYTLEDCRIEEVPCGQWEWAALPFLHHINTVSKPILSRLLSSAESPEEVTPDELQAALAHTFPRLFGPLREREDHEVRAFFTQQFIAAQASRLEGSGSAATIPFAAAHLAHCVPCAMDIPTLLIVMSSPSLCASTINSRKLSHRLHAIRQFESAGLLSEVDVRNAVQQVMFKPLVSAGASSTYVTLASSNVDTLTVIVWNLLVSTMWKALLDTFSATRTRVSPTAWASVASVCLLALGTLRTDPTIQSLADDSEGIVCFDCINLVTPLIMQLFPAPAAAPRRFPAVDEKKIEVVRKVLSIIRRQRETHADLRHCDKLVHMYASEEVIRLLRYLPRESDTLLEFFERVFLSGCQRFSSELSSVFQKGQSPRVISDFMRLFGPDLKFVMQVLNGRVQLPQAFRVSVLDCVGRVLLGEPLAVEWFISTVNVEMDVSNLRAPPPVNFSDVHYVWEVFRNVVSLSDENEYPTHPCLTCPLADALFAFLSKVEETGSSHTLLTLSRRVLEFKSRPSYTFVVTQDNRVAVPGWYDRVTAAVLRRQLLEALVADACVPCDEQILPGRLMASGMLRTHCPPELQAVISSLLIRPSSQLYFVSRLLEMKGREYVTGFVNHPENMLVLGPWLEQFQAVYPLETDYVDPVRAIRVGLDHLSLPPFMWPRPVVDPRGLTPAEAEENKAFDAFFTSTVRAFLAAEASRDCTVALTASGWWAVLEGLAGGAGDGNTPGQLRAKMFLFSCIAWVWFNRDEQSQRRCSPVAVHMDRIAGVLGLNDREKVLFSAFADPVAFNAADPGRKDDVTRLFFRPAGLSLEDKRQRSAVMVMVATILGTPRDSHPFYTHLYNPDKLFGTFGTGSYYNVVIMNGTGVHYDSGTVLNVDGIWERGVRAPLTDTASLGALYIALFGVCALGLTLYPDLHDKCLGPVFTDYYDSTVEDNWAVLHRNFGRRPEEQPRDRQDWLRNFVWSRFTSGWGVVTGFAIPSADERCVAMVAMVNTFRILLEANRPICMPLFNDVNHCLVFETFWVTNCYLPSRDNRRAIVGRLEACLSENQLVEKVGLMRLRLPQAANLVQDLANGVRYPPEYEFLAHLASATTLLRHLGLMPKLIALYDWLNDSLAYTLTLEDLSQPVRATFTKYAARGGDAIAELYGSICDGWNAMHTALGGELAVGACGLNQKFHPIDDSTGLATFLTLNDDEVGNVLIRVIDYLVNRHNTFLAKVPGVKPPTIPTQYVTDATLVPDVTESFLAVVSRNHLTPEESVGGNQFRLNRIAHDMLTLVCKPEITAPAGGGGQRFQRPFLFKIESRVDAGTDIDFRAKLLVSDLSKQHKRYLHSLRMLPVAFYSPLEADAQAIILDIMQSLSLRAEFDSLEFLISITKIVSQTQRIVAVESRLQCGVTSLAGEGPVSSVESPDEPFSKQVPPAMFIQDFAATARVTQPVINDAAYTQLFCQPLAHLGPIMSLVWKQLSQHPDLFSLYPSYMQTELSKREKERLRDSLLRLFPSYSERVDALSLLIQILDNVELEQAIECEPSMDTTPLSGALSLLGYLDSRKETDRTLLALIPDTIRARPHYAKLKAFLFVSCVGLHDGLSAPSADIPYIPVHRSLFSPSVAHPPAAVRTPVVSAALLSRLFPPDRPATSRRPLVPAAPPPPPAPPVPQDEKKSAVVRKGDKS